VVAMFDAMREEFGIVDIVINELRSIEGRGDAPTTINLDIANL